ncbi:MAG: hypothetical protein HKP58_07145, partial [Desulfatitalea sp.]|nr:hypothetical protein [Desulfatitalea sp.]NNK00173.1 hypothetical protein [Desulfatitalea sp.]
MVTKKVHIGFFFLVAVSIITISPCPLGASEVSLFDKPLRYFGVLSQTFAYGWNDDYDTYKGFNQATTTAFLEGDYSPIDNFSLYSMLSLTGDLAYAINNDSEKWNNRQFDKAGEDLAFDDEYWRILKELHGTWNINTALIRVGKQIVSWGELTGVRLLDQINPSDSTRGISDIEFETSIVPTWLVRTDFRLPVNSALVSDATLQFVYDPNVDNDIYSRSFLPGNDVMGVWAPYIE